MKKLNKNQISAGILLFCLAIYPLIHNQIKNGLHSAFHNVELELLKRIVNNLKIYDVYDQQGPLILKRFGRDNDGGYVVPIHAFEKADVLMGFGIADDSSFEESFANVYNKASYGFDCGVKELASENKLFHFYSKCISSESYIYKDQNSSNATSTFPELLTEHDLFNKNIFIKMDIEGAEYEAFDDILPYAKNIPGIVMELHLSKHFLSIYKAFKLLPKLNEEFVLVHLHVNNCLPGEELFKTTNSNSPVPVLLELSFINKNLVSKSVISQNQKHPTSIDMPNCPKNPDIDFEILQ